MNQQERAGGHHSSATPCGCPSFALTGAVRHCLDVGSVGPLHALWPWSCHPCLATRGPPSACRRSAASARLKKKFLGISQPKFLAVSSLKVLDCWTAALDNFLRCHCRLSLAPRSTPAQDGRSRDNTFFPSSLWISIAAVLFLSRPHPSTPSPSLTRYWTPRDPHALRSDEQTATSKYGTH